jgi:hypothetical protein
MNGKLRTLVLMVVLMASTGASAKPIVRTTTTNRPHVAATK